MKSENVNLGSLKIAHRHTMSPPVHVSNISAVNFSILALPWQEKGTVNERINEGICVGC